MGRRTHLVNLYVHDGEQVKAHVQVATHDRGVATHAAAAMAAAAAAANGSKANIEITETEVA